MGALPIHTGGDLPIPMPDILKGIIGLALQVSLFYVSFFMLPIPELPLGFNI